MVDKPELDIGDDAVPNKRKLRKSVPLNENPTQDLRTHPGRTTLQTESVVIPDVPESHVDMPPEEVARRAFNHGQLLDPASRQRALQTLCSRSPMADSQTGRALNRILQNADRAVDILSLVGYQTLRHLRANGNSVAQIALDLGLNVNDLTAYMSQAPSAAEDAMIDEEAYADTKASELLSELETARPTSSLDTDILKTRMNFLLEYNKRLSHKWAQRTDEEVLARMPTLNINLSMAAPTAASRIVETGGQALPDPSTVPTNGVMNSSVDHIDDGVTNDDMISEDIPMVEPIMLTKQEDSE